jgi:ribosomal protein S18 acetylase RimI-like enzyme
MKKEFHVLVSKEITNEEYASLMQAVGFGEVSDYNSELVIKSISNSSLVVCARNPEGKLIGYLNVLSDGAFSAIIDLIVVDPTFQRRGVGSELIKEATKHFNGIPIFIISFEDQIEFFLKQGYKIPKRSMKVLSKKN